MNKAIATLLLAGLTLLTVGLLPASAETDQVCTGLDSGKIDTSGDPASVTVSAPSGYLIDGYCAKAGSTKQGDGPEYFTVDPPASSVVIAHSSGKALSHYSVSYVKPLATTTTTTVETTTTSEPTTTTTEGTTTTTAVETTTTTVRGTTTTTVGTPCEEDGTCLAYTGGPTDTLVPVGIALLVAGTALAFIKRKAMVT